MNKKFLHKYYAQYFQSTVFKEFWCPPLGTMYNPSKYATTRTNHGFQTDYQSLNPISRITQNLPFYAIFYYHLHHLFTSVYTRGVQWQAFKKEESYGGLTFASIASEIQAHLIPNQQQWPGPSSANKN